MATTVQSTLLALGTGAAYQRVCQLVATGVIAHRLGVERTGHYLQGVTAGAVLAVLAGAGVRSIVARQAAQEPERAGAWIRAAVRVRLCAGLVLAAMAVLAVLLVDRDPLFWSLCCLLVLPAAFDLKGLLDATARTRFEVLLESAAGTASIAMVAAWSLAGGDSLIALAAIQLGSRCLYALGALHAVRRLPAGTASLRGMLRLSGRTALAHVAAELLLTGDLWLVAAAGGPTAAGLYAVGQRIAVAATLPSAQLARLLLPHLHRAARGGDPARTALTALRAVAWATLPVCAGGMVVSAPLCAWFGAGFAAGGPVLQLLLLAAVVMHLGWQCSYALFAAGRDRAYARTLLLPALAYGALLPGLCAGAGALGAGLAQALAQGLYAAAAWCALRRKLALPLGSAFAAPAAAALLTAGAAWCAQGVGPGWLAPLPQVFAGALVYACVLWALELRGRVRRIGEGLVQASGFGR